MQMPEAGQRVNELTIRDYVAVLVRQKWLVLGIMGAALLVAAAYSFLTPTTYQSTSAVVLRTTNNTSQFPSIGAADRARFQRQPEAELEYVESTIFRNAASAASPDAAAVRVEYDDDDRQRRSSQLFFVSEARDPIDAQRAAAVWAEYYVDNRAASDIAEIETSITGLEAQIADLEVEKEEILEPISPIDNALLTETDSDTISRLTTQRLSLRQAIEDDLLPVTLQLRTLSQDLSTLRIASGYAARENNAARVSIEPAPGRKVAPRTLQNLVLGGLFGLLLAGAGAVLSDGWRAVIREPSDIDELGSGVPVLARLPEFPRDTIDPLALAADSSTQYAQSVERVVSALLYRKVAAGESEFSVLFTSSIPSEGKTSVASHVSQRLGSTQNRTILIDADLRRPDVMQTFRVEPVGRGFGELLATQESLVDHLRPVRGAPQLRLMATFAGTDNAAQLLRQQFDASLTSLSGEYDMLLIDAPPVLAVADAEVMAHTVDAVVLVVRAGRTTRSQLLETLSKLDAANAKVVGFVLVGARNDAANKYSYSYEQTRAMGQRSATKAPAAAAPPSTVAAAADRSLGGVDQPTRTAPRKAEPSPSEPRKRSKKSPQPSSGSSQPVATRAPARAGGAGAKKAAPRPKNSRPKDEGRRSAKSASPAGSSRPKKRTSEEREDRSAREKATLAETDFGWLDEATNGSRGDQSDQ